jgi:predicted AAA+ superfamily ATPase
MWENIQVNRILSRHLPDASSHQLILITGARQTGKTTLVKKQYEKLPYYNLDAIEYRDQLSSISTFNWSKEVGNSVIDEIQKEPGLFDKIKYAFDEGTLSFSVFTGSSQILLLKKIQETLAGRVSLRELFPFMFRELFDHNGANKEPILLERLVSVKKIDKILNVLNSVLIGETSELHNKVEEWLNIWGGMAPLIHITNPDEQKFWLKDYAIAYLERDLADLAKLNDLKPFRKFQQITALRTANLISYTELAKDAGIAIESARRYLEYLRISYQTFLIQPYHKNLTSALVKTPKLYWFDNGLLRHLSGLGFDIDNEQLYENYVASEIIKYIRTNRLDVKLSFYRTRSGMEIDFILESIYGIIAIEVKNRSTISKSDFTNMKRLSEVLGYEWCGGMVIYRGNKIQQFSENMWAVPSYRLFN